MFRGKRSPTDTRSVSCRAKCPFLSEKELRLQIIFAGEIDFLPVEPQGGLSFLFLLSEPRFA